MMRIDFLATGLIRCWGLRVACMLAPQECESIYRKKRDRFVQGLDVGWLGERKSVSNRNRKKELGGGVIH